MPSDLNRPGRRGPTRRGRLVAEPLETRQLLATITVNTTGDADGADGGSTLSLRQAIEISNGTLAISALSTDQAGLVVGALTIPNAIDFAIPGAGPFVIEPATALPSITSPVVIDGYSQPGAHPNTNGPGQGEDSAILIELDGAMTRGAAGLDIRAGQSTVQGLAIGGFGGGGGAGILLEVHSGDLILGNDIGTDATGTKALPNLAGGIEDIGGGSTIGGTAAGAGNVISGNGGDGLEIQGDPSSPLLVPSDLVEGNLIGTDATGTRPLPNAGDGIRIDDTEGFSNNQGPSTIGGSAAGAGNVIAFNGRSGVDLAAFLSALISRNSIYANGDLGINVALALDYAPTPLLESVTPSGSGSLVTGTVDSGTFYPVFPYTIEFFANAAPDPSGFGQGQTYLGSTEVTTDEIGHASFTFSTPVDLAGLYVSATASLAGAATSGFSQDLLGYTASPTTTTLVGPGPTATFGQPVSFVATVASPLPGALAGEVAFVDAGEVVFTDDDRYLATVPLNPFGMAVLDTDGLSPGSHSIQATYLGTANLFSPSASQAVALTILGRATTTTLTGPSGLPTVGQPVTFTASVQAPGSTPTGFVAFTEDGVQLGLEFLDGSDVATFTTTGLGPGNHVIQAAYLGNPGFTPSLSNAVTAGVLPTVAHGGPTVTSIASTNLNTITIAFSRHLLVATAQDLANYAIIGPDGHAVAIESAAYDPADDSVTLTTRQMLKPHRTYRVTVDGRRVGRVDDVDGIPLSGKQGYPPGTSFAGKVTTPAVLHAKKQPAGHKKSPAVPKARH